MVELNIDFNELEHMDLEDVKNIIVKFDTEDWEKEENRTIKVGNKEFFLNTIDSSNWHYDNNSIHFNRYVCKYQYKTNINLLCCIDEKGKLHKYDVLVTQDIKMPTSYYSNEEPIQILKLNQVVQITIPARTVVTID